MAPKQVAIGTDRVIPISGLKDLILGQKHREGVMEK